MSIMLSLKAFLNDRLAAAAEDIFCAVEKTITEYKEEIFRSKDLEINRLRMQLTLLKTGLCVFLLSDPGTDNCLPSQHHPSLESHHFDEEEEDGGSSSTMEQEHAEPSEIKKEQQKSHRDFWTSHDEEQLEGLDSDIKDFISASSSLKTGLQEPSLTFHPYHNDGNSDESRDKPYSCSMCEKTFTNNSNLTAHIRTHTGERPYRCEICRKTFITTSALNRHQTIHTEGKHFICNFCGKSFKWMDSLTRHVRSVHKRDHVPVGPSSVTLTGPAPLRPRAPFISPSKMSIMLSLKAFLNDRLAAAAEDIFCAVEKTITEYKEEIFRSKDLEINRLRMQLTLLKTGLCVFLPLEPGTDNCLPSQLQPSHHHHAPPPPRQHHPSLETSESHHFDEEEEDGGSSSTMEQEHAEPSEIKKEQQKSHRDFWTSHDEEQLEGLDSDIKDFISASSSLKTGLQEPSLTFHPYHNNGNSDESRDKPYSCSVCEKRFSNCSHLTAHIRTHTGERPYRCEICRKTFITTSALNRHQTIHTEGKHFICNFCGKSFKWMESLGRHVRSVHKRDHVPVGPS
ncbi:zinc finger protein 39-like [Cynoglossus semilaevis]|uniref:zinc finger protein 39-like n=1 Tax=Cynoglossus semilaevis TaxID=244447 RepID=UPI000D62480A|nr:zinc finger protein 39-like [Cynoglossus semilaevis]